MRININYLILIKTIFFANMKIFPRHWFIFVILYSFLAEKTAKFNIIFKCLFSNVCIFLRLLCTVWAYNIIDWKTTSHRGNLFFAFNLEQDFCLLIKIEYLWQVSIAKSSLKWETQKRLSNKKLPIALFSRSQRELRQCFF